jgi:hypothetical protein
MYKMDSKIVKKENKRMAEFRLITAPAHEISYNERKSCSD